MRRSNRHDAKAAAAEHSEDTKNFGNLVGRKGIEDRQVDVFTTFPDWHMEIVQMIGSGDVVVVRARVSGTHKGVAKMALNGVPVGTAPTGKRFEVTHMHWYTLRDGEGCRPLGQSGRSGHASSVGTSTTGRRRLQMNYFRLGFTLPFLLGGELESEFGGLFS